MCIMYMYIFFFQSKPIQARGKKGLDGDAQCEEDDNYTSEHLACEKQSEDSSQHPDANSHEHLVSF